MGHRVSGTDIVDVVSPILDQYSDEVQKAVKDEIVSAADTAVSELRTTSPKRTGAYARSWKHTAWDGKKVRVYNQWYYQITHLLENGHINARGGGRVKAIVHIEPVSDSIEKRLPVRIAARLKG